MGHRGPDRVFLHCIFICSLYKLSPPGQAQVTLQLRVSLADLVLKFLAGPPLLAGPKIFFLQSLNPLSAALNRNVS